VERYKVNDMGYGLQKEPQVTFETSFSLLTHPNMTHQIKLPCFVQVF